MTVSTSTNSVVYRGNGATTQFTVPFKVLDEDHLVVTRRDYDTGVLDYTYVGTDYSFSGIGNDSGTLTLAGDALEDDFELVIERIVPYTQDLDIVNAGGFYPETVEEQLDMLVMGMQQLAARMGRAITVPIGDTVDDLPNATSRAGKFPVFDVDGNLTIASGTGGDSALRTDMAQAEGGALLGVSYDFVDAPAGSILNIFRSGPVVLLHMLRKATETDDNSALARAKQIALPVYMQGGEGAADDGAFLIDTAITVSNLWSGAEIFGDGMTKTVVRKSEMDSNHYVFLFDSGQSSADHANQGWGIHLHDFQIEDDPDRVLGFAEHQHLIMLSGVTRPCIERMRLIGQRGDGICFGSSNIAATERHNRDAVVRDVFIDGLDKNNRNGISVIDCDGWLFENLTINRTTRQGDGTNNAPDPLDPSIGAGMVGAIDCEPDANAFAIVRNGFMKNIKVSGCGGVGIGLLLLANSFVTTPHRNFKIEGLEVFNSKGGFALNGYSGTDAIPDSNPLHGIPYGIEITNAHVSFCTRAFTIDGINQARISRSTFTDIDTQAVVGFTTYNYDIIIEECRFQRLGLAASGGTTGMFLNFIDSVTLLRNRFIDNGVAGGGAGRHIYLLSGNIDRLKLIDNEFSTPQGRTTTGITTAANVNFGNCEERGSIWHNALASDFKPNGSTNYSAAPTSGTWAVGNRVYNGAAAAGGVSAWQCTTAGTLGTLNGSATTADTTNGSAVVTPSSMTGLGKGMKITIAGVTGVKTIVSVDSDNSTITVDSNCDATVNDGAVAYSAAVFKAAETLAA